MSYRAFDEIDYGVGLDGYLDLSLSKKYPALVDRESIPPDDIIHQQINSYQQPNMKEGATTDERDAA